jgi:thiamine biosynthesis lipoprotein ApbE
MNPVDRGSAARADPITGEGALVAPKSEKAPREEMKSKSGLDRVGFKEILAEGEALFLGLSGVCLDLGAIGKGFAGDRAAILTVKDRRSGRRVSGLMSVTVFG